MSVWPPNGLTNYAVCLTKLANRSAAGEMGRPLIHASRASPQQEHHLPCFAYLLLRVRHSVGAGCHARYVYPQQPRFARNAPDFETNFRESQMSSLPFETALTEPTPRPRRPAARPSA